MPDVAFAVPGDLSSPTGGYAYARKLLGLAPDHGVNLIHLALPGGFPHPSAEELAETERRLASAAAPLLLRHVNAFEVGDLRGLGHHVGLEDQPPILDQDPDPVLLYAPRAAQAEADLVLLHRVDAALQLRHVRLHRHQ